MISTISVIEMLHNWRDDKMALVCFVSYMGGDSVFEAWERLDQVLPQIQEVADKSRGRKPEIDVNHDLANRVRNIAEEIEPWLKQLAERERGIKIGSLT